MDSRIVLSPLASGMGRTAPRSVLARYVVDEETGCWLYTGARSAATGYGMVNTRLDNGVRSSAGAHRVFYEARVGPIPAGLHIDHLCRNRPCVNPDHLEPVTTGENQRRGWRDRHSHCPHGHEFTAENTMWSKAPSGRPYRRCRTCFRQRDAAAKRRRRAAQRSSPIGGAGRRAR